MRKNLLRPCPHCDAVATYTTIHDTTPPNYDEREEGELYHAIVECDNCGEVILLIFEAVREPLVHDGFYIDIQLVDQYPKRIPMFHESIPPHVVNDYVEAIKCFDVGAWKASVVMCRRALQGSVIERGSTKSKLADQIDDLHNNEIITKDIKDWAHEIRLTGNIGAHPSKDGLEDVTEEDAKELIAFVEEYLNFVYIMPSKVAAKRSKKKT